MFVTIGTTKNQMINLDHTRNIILKEKTITFYALTPGYTTMVFPSVAEARSWFNDLGACLAEKDKHIEIMEANQPRKDHLNHSTHSL